MGHCGHQILACFYSYLLLSASPTQASLISLRTRVKAAEGVTSSSQAHVLSLRTRGMAGEGAASRSQSGQLWFDGLFGGNEVCQERLFSDPHASVERFEYKLNKFKNLLNDAAEHPTSSKAFELRRRAEKFRTCFKYALTSAMPAELKDLITSQSEGSLKHTLQTMRVNVVNKLKGLGMFPSQGECGFNPEKVDIVLAAAGDNPDMLVSKQLFGERCEVVSGLVYRSGRTEMEQKLIDTESLSVTEELKAKLDMVSPDEIARVSKQLEQAVDAELDNLESSDSSLVELGAVVQAPPEPITVGTVVSALILIAVLCIFVLYMLWMVSVLICLFVCEGIGLGCSCRF